MGQGFVIEDYFSNATIRNLTISKIQTDFLDDTTFLNFPKIKKDLKEELRKAKQFIFLEFFIIEEGKMWGQILEILANKVKEGVDVGTFASLYGGKGHKNAGSCKITNQVIFDLKMKR